MKAGRSRSCAWIVTVSLVAGGAAFAADPQSGTPDPAQRQKMAEIHERMAACLRTDRPFEVCRAEMRESCQTAMGQAGCPMMGIGGGGMGPGMMDRSGRTPGSGMMPGGANPPANNP